MLSKTELVDYLRDVRETESFSRLDALIAEIEGGDLDRISDALHRLVEVAEGCTGQSHHVRRFLLGLYNADEWPFEMNRLKALDADLQRACLTVLGFNTVGARREIHEYITDGNVLMLGFWEREEAGDD